MLSQTSVLKVSAHYTRKRAVNGVDFWPAGQVSLEIALTFSHTDATLRTLENRADASLPAYATLRMPPSAQRLLPPLVSLTSSLYPVFVVQVPSFKKYWIIYV